jgi:hypothetical protein
MILDRPLARLQLTASQMLSTGVGSALAMTASLAPTISSWTSLLTITVRASEALAGCDTATQLSDLAIVKLVRDAYLTQARLALILVVGGVVAVGLLILAISGIMVFVRHRTPRNS